MPGRGSKAGYTEGNPSISSPSMPSPPIRTRNHPQFVIDSLSLSESHAGPTVVGRTVEA